jgi:XTP/dITP diphosphohydrolase
METIYYVTGNLGKVKQAQKYLDELDIEMVNYNFIEPDINDITYTAIWKVKKAYEMLGKPCIALDSGFYIPNYPKETNFPGAFVHRKIIDGIGLDGLLEDMKDISDRTCYFLECLAYYDGVDLKVFYGKSDGTLANKISLVDNDKKWSELWKIFIPFGYDKSQSELTEEERENRPNVTKAFLEFKKWYQEKEKQLIKSK